VVDERALLQALGEVHRALMPETRRAIEDALNPGFGRLERSLEAIAAEVHEIRLELDSVKATITRLEARFGS
jgi:hypothetical protein